MSHAKCCAAIVLLLLFCAAPLSADEPAVAVREAVSTQPGHQQVVSDDITVMPEVTVTSTPEDPAEKLNGSNRLESDVIKQLPAKNNSINEIISVLPGVQLTEEARTSNNAGEILPPRLSISGGRFYDNTMQIDGISNNSLLDPAFDLETNTSNVPGHPEQLFVNPDLIESLTIYRSNIPARYSGFTGGVVDMTSRDPAKVFGGKLDFRTTEDDWTAFHVDRQFETDFENSDDLDVDASAINSRSVDVSSQPRFEKYEGGIGLDIPINESSGLLFDYSQTKSIIPKQQLLRWHSQRRKLEQVMLKYVDQFSSNTTFRLTASASPYESDLFLKDVRGSDYTIENGAYSVTANVEHATDFGDVEINLNWRTNRNNRMAPHDYFVWWSSPTKPWGSSVGSIFSKEGGYGDLEKTEEAIALGTHLQLLPRKTKSLIHNISTGVDLEYISSRFERFETASGYTGSSRNDNVVCSPGAVDCFNNGAGDAQFMYHKAVYPEDEAVARVLFFDAYLDDLMEWGRLTVRPGVHLSYNDLQENIDVGPRLAAAWDLFGDGKTTLSAGINRYYGKTLMTHALESEKAPSQRWRRGLAPTAAETTFAQATALQADNTPKPWQHVDTRINAIKLADTDSPYSDELTVGLTQKLFGGNLDLLYIKRNNEDELSVTVLPRDANNYVFTEWTNNGSTDHEEVSLGWERQWRHHYLNVNITWQETSTSHTSYNDDFDVDEILDPVWFRGQVINRSELPRPDFNRDVVANLTWIAELPRGFTFTNVTKYRSGYKAMDDTRTNINTPYGSLDIYEEVELPESWLFDWRLDWEKEIAKDRSVILTVEVDNVFNQKVNSGSFEDIYELGRQIWLGMTYKF